MMPRFILITESKTTGQTCYYDGHRFTILRASAREYDDIEEASRLSDLLTEEFRQPVDLHPA